MVRQDEALDESTSSTDDTMVVDTPDVVLRIDEPDRDPPVATSAASATTSSLPVSPLQRAPSSGIPRVTPPRTQSANEEPALDAKTVIENVKNKAKSGGDFNQQTTTVRQEVVTKTSSAQETLVSRVTSTTTKVVTSADGLLVDANQNKQELTDIFDAFVDGKAVPAASPKLTNEKRESPSRVSRLPSASGIAPPTKRQESSESASLTKVCSCLKGHFLV